LRSFPDCYPADSLLHSHSHKDIQNTRRLAHRRCSAPVWVRFSAAAGAEEPRTKKIRPLCRHGGQQASAMIANLSLNLRGLAGNWRESRGSPSVLRPILARCQSPNLGRGATPDLQIRNSLASTRATPAPPPCGASISVGQWWPMNALHPTSTSRRFRVSDPSIGCHHSQQPSPTFRDLHIPTLHFSHSAMRTHRPEEES